MRTKKKLLAGAAILTGCILIAWLSTSIQGGEIIYEIRPQISIPEYRTDAARAIDAYERLMRRYMTLNERNLTTISTDLKEVVKKLNSIDAKLTGLTTRIARIENSLGIEQPKNPTRKEPCKSPSPPAKN